MPKRIAPLIETQIKNFKPQAKATKLFDGGGLFLFVTPSGGKLWHFKYRFEGKEKKMTFGSYPEITLAKARERREEARRMVAEGRDPGVVRKEKAAARKAEELKTILTFEKVAREWLEKQADTWADSHTYDTMRKMERNIFPEIGPRPISEIGLTESLECLRKIEARGIGETAKRCNIIMGQVFRYAAACGWRTDDPTALLKGALAPVKAKEFPAIVNPKELTGLLRAIDGYSGSPVIRAALFLGPLVVLRPGELRHGTWNEIDFEAAQWNIPGNRMKLKKDHIVPLSRQVVEILKQLQPITGASRYILPNGWSFSKPLSENGVRAALISLGVSRSTLWTRLACYISHYR